MSDDNHDLLVKAYLEYFKANEKWVRKRSYRAYYKTQQWLRQIRHLSKVVQDENHDYFYTHIKPKK